MPASTNPGTVKVSPSPSQAPARGFETMQMVGACPLSLPDPATQLDLAQITARRLTVTLVKHRYLTPAPGRGCRLGPKLLELDRWTRQQIDLVQIERPRLKALADLSGGTVHLEMRYGGRAFPLQGSRSTPRYNRQPCRRPACADTDRTRQGAAVRQSARPLARTLRRDQPYGTDADFVTGTARMADYVETDRTFDLEENEEQIRCVGAPVRDAKRRVVGAPSLSIAAQYIYDAQMATLADDVIGAAAISRELGLNLDAAARPRSIENRRPS